jgi:hypothetical protein
MRQLIAKIGLVAAVLSMAYLLITPSFQKASNFGIKTVFIPISDAKGLLGAHVDTPEELKSRNAEELAKTWPSWAATQDAKIRLRVAKGEEDSLANLLLYGVSFTSEPRITDAYRQKLVMRLGSEQAADQRIEAAIMTRATDLGRALANPGQDERRLTMLDVATRAESLQKTKDIELQLAQYLFDNLVRCLNENRALAIEAASQQSNEPEKASVALASLYRTRGLSTDTSILVDYAVNQTLQNMRNEGLLRQGSVRRIGIVGPGLDLIDKQGGYDLHPPQMLQPFMLIDSLLELQLAQPESLTVSTFDVSHRVTQHIQRAVKRAHNDHSYSLHLVLDDEWKWSPEAVSYWKTCGNQVGKLVESSSLSDLNGVVTRKLQVDPNWVKSISPFDLNIVYQRLVLAEEEKFDLLIATNILCYYGPFEQSLAMQNAASMLRSRGILLTTEVLPKNKDLDLHAIGSTYVVTSESKGFSIVWYQKKI